MTDMQRFCHVDAGIVDADVFAFTYVLIAVRFAFRHGLFDYALVVGLFVQSEIEISRHGFRFFKAVGQGNRRSQFFRDGNRRFSESLRKSEARQAKIAHLAVFRRGNESGDFRRGNAFDFYQICNNTFVIHVAPR